MSHPYPSPPILLTLVVGLAAGFMSGLFGVGGGILVVPALVLLLHMEQRLAHGTSLAAVLPISAISLLTYWSQGNVDWWLALWLSLGALGGAVLGTRLLHVVPHRALGYGFAALLVATAIRLFIPTEATGRDPITVGLVLVAVVLGIAAGTLAGLLGVGGGIILVPAMVVLFGELPVVAKGTSVAVIIPTSLMGTWRNRQKANADLRTALVVGIGGIPAAIAGGVISDRMSDDLSNVLFALLVLAVAARLIWDLERERRHEPPIAEGDL
jgi:uncharacterized membrane protein YfcA